MEISGYTGTHAFYTGEDEFPDMQYLGPGLPEDYVHPRDCMNANEHMAVATAAAVNSTPHAHGSNQHQHQHQHHHHHKQQRPRHKIHELDSYGRRRKTSELDGSYWKQPKPSTLTLNTHVSANQSSVLSGCDSEDMGESDDGSPAQESAQSEQGSTLVEQQQPHQQTQWHLSQSASEQVTVIASGTVASATTPVTRVSTLVAASLSTPCVASPSVGQTEACASRPAELPNDAASSTEVDADGVEMRNLAREIAETKPLADTLRALVHCIGRQMNVHVIQARRKLATATQSNRHLQLKLRSAIDECTGLRNLNADLERKYAEKKKMCDAFTFQFIAKSGIVEKVQRSKVAALGCQRALSTADITAADLSAGTNTAVLIVPDTTAVPPVTTAPATPTTLAIPLDDAVIASPAAIASNAQACEASVAANNQTTSNMADTAAATVPASTSESSTDKIRTGPSSVERKSPSISDSPIQTQLVVPDLDVLALFAEDTNLVGGDCLEASPLCTEEDTDLIGGDGLVGAL